MKAKSLAHLHWQLQRGPQLAKSDIVKISDDDLQWLAGEDTPVEEAAAALLEQGPALIILTRGQAGATGFMTGGHSVAARCKPTLVA